MALLAASLVVLTLFWLNRFGAQAEPRRRAARLPQFVEVSEAAGIRFRHNSGARGLKYMPETVGSGCAFLDYNRDGWPDLFLVNSCDWPGSTTRKPSFSALYRNNRDGTFTDVTTEAGLRSEQYGMGAAIGDYDADGWPDLFLTCIGPNVLYRNRGDGTFEDVTQAAGVRGKATGPEGLRWKWSASAAWLDYDRDGLLDLYVGNYVRWSPTSDVRCETKDGRKAYCPPNSYEGTRSILYRNEGKGRFRDVSSSVGLEKLRGKSFGVAVADYNGDGWPDLAISNDTSPNFLLINQQGKSFEDRGLESGIALAASGNPKAGMGIDTADWKNDGRFGLLVGNFSEECLSLFDNDGAALFTDRAYPMGMGESSLTSLTFGLFFFDFDLDGWQDAFAANGHIDTFVNENNALVTYEQRPLLYRNLNGKRFQEVGQMSGPALSEKLVLRGAACADFDRDGDPDIAAVVNNGPARLWRNEGGNQNHWIRLELRGEHGNSAAIGARVRVTAGGFTQQALVKSGSSFLSQSELPLTFGLGGVKRADRVEVVWPTGETEVWTDLAANASYRVSQGGRPEAIPPPKP